MKAKKRLMRKPALVAFWDTSAIVPLCCFQSHTAKATQTARTYARQVTWWATAVEALSSFNRLYRERNLTLEGKQRAMNRLTFLRNRWNEIQPTSEVRDTAERLLNVHSLRAADALQLSAALVWCSHHVQGRCFVAGDADLAKAAEAEGFIVIRFL